MVKIVWLGGDEKEFESQSVVFLAVINEETDVEKLASKVLQLREFLRNSDTKPDPDESREVS
ncbi:MAG: hypothetical protein HXS48_16250 [Theionarchaea archaeon]|nr:hypothetical protein [Theionarchaea archaeon]